jgi:hypothetical protein
VQQNEPPGGQLFVAPRADDLGSEGHGIRGNALRGWHFGDPHLGTQPGCVQVREGARKISGRIPRHRSSSHPPRVSGARPHTGMDAP